MNCQFDLYDAFQLSFDTGDLYDHIATWYPPDAFKAFFRANCLDLIRHFFYDKDDSGLQLHCQYDLTCSAIMEGLRKGGVEALRHYDYLSKKVILISYETIVHYVCSCDVYIKMVPFLIAEASCEHKIPTTIITSLPHLFGSNQDDIRHTARCEEHRIVLEVLLSW